MFFIDERRRHTRNDLFFFRFPTPEVCFVFTAPPVRRQPIVHQHSQPPDFDLCAKIKIPVFQRGFSYRSFFFSLYVTTLTDWNIPPKTEKYS